jgi:WD40 repeat protein
MANGAHDASSSSLSKPADPGTTDRGKLRVFLSYSRDDLEFADQLDAALRACGFDCTLDRHSVSGGEEWKRRLGSLISEADTVVFVLSPSSARSEMCAWEVKEAGRLNKRILPVICRPLLEATPPPRLQELNFIFFHAESKVPGSGFGTGLAQLSEALKTDFDWLRLHTRYLQRAIEWEHAKWPENRLLLGDDIAEAKAWSSRRPASAPEPTTLHLDFIRASEEAAEARGNAQRRQLESVASAQAERETALRDAEEALKRAADAQRHRARNRNIALLIVTISALVAGWLWQRAEKQRGIADAASRKEIAARRETEIALAGSYFHQSISQMEGDKPFEALAYAARAVALDPDNDAARGLMLDLLLWRPWPRLSVRVDSEVTSVAISADGRRLIVAAGGKAFVYDPGPGGVRAKRLGDTRSSITAVALTGDGKIAATGDASGGIHLWIIDSSRMDGSSFNLQDSIKSLSFSGDGRRLLGAARSGAQVWDAVTGASIGPRISSTPISSAEFGSEGRRVVTVEESGSGPVEVWDYEHGVHVGPPVSAGGGGGYLQYACLDRSGQYLMTGAYAAPSFARVWDAKTGQPLSPPLVLKDFPIRGRFLEDGHKLLTISRDGSARVWNWSISGTPSTVELTHEGSLWSAAVSDDGSWVATGATDGSVHVWDRRTGVRRPLTVPSEGAVAAGALSANGEIAVSAVGSHVWIMQMSTGSVQRIDLDVSAEDVAIANDGRRLAFSTDRGRRTYVLETSGSRHLLQTESRSQHDEMELGDLPSFHLHYSDSIGLLVHSYGRYADLLDAGSGRLIGKQLRHEDLLRFVGFSRDGERLVTASRDGTVRVWNSRTGDEAMPPFPHREATLAAAFTAKEDRVMSASRNALLWSWDLASRRAPPPVALHGAGLIGGACFGRDGTRVATTDYVTVTVSDTRTGLPLTSLPREVRPTKLRLSDDGTRLLTVGADVSVWDLPMVTKSDAVVLSRWGEAVAGLRMSEPQGIHAIDNREALLEGLRKESGSPSRTEPIWKMVHWFFSDPAQRAAWPR